jgi:vitamin B12 transporter
MKKNFFVLAALVISSQLHAQQDSTVKTLDEVVVTANKFEQKQSQTGKVISVINKDQLEKSGGKTLAQVLNEQVGLFIAGAANAPGSVQTVFMRGASSGRTLVLMDGIPVNDPSMINNEFDLNLISLNDVERIEICKGAQSTLYGSDAIAGVINIITVKKDIRQPLNVHLTSGAGNKNTFRNNIQVYGQAGRLTYTTRFAKLRTDGFSAAYDSTGIKNFDKDGYDGNVANAALRYQVSPSLQVKSFIQHSQYKADIDAGVFADEKDYSIQNSSLLSGAGIFFSKGKIQVTANYQYNELKRKYVNDSLYVRPFGTRFENNQYNGRTRYAELYGNLTASKWLNVLIGTDYRYARMNQDYYSLSSFGPYSSHFDDTTLHQTSVYASFIVNTADKKLNVELGGRSNWHSRYGSNSTFTFNPSYLLHKNWRVFGSIASGFKAPSIFQVFDAFSGNAELKPETSINYELGMQQLHKKISSRIVFFHRKLKNGIDFNYQTFQYFNFIKQNVNGLELELITRLTSQMTVSANYTYITGKEQTQSRKSFNDTTFSYLLRRPKHNINLNAAYQFTDNLFASINIKTVSSRYDVGGYKKDDVLLDHYVLLNAYAEYKWKKQVKFFAGVQNIAGKQFFDIRGYNAIPRLINGGIRMDL